jgi:hypothetical protein
MQDRFIGQVDPCSDTARVLIRRQLWTETASIRSGPDKHADPFVTDPGIWFDSVSSDIDGVTVLRGFTQISHWHAYVVACHEDKVYKMAGFEDSDVQGLSSALRRRVTSEADAVRFAQFIVTALESEPRQSLVITPLGQGDPTDKSMITKWNTVRPATWPQEHATRFAGGATGVTLTRVTHDGVSIKAATSCSLIINAEGEVLAISCFATHISH